MPAITAFASSGFDGELVSVEVDVRRGIPGIDMVGLPDGAVREARERVRVAVRNSGYSFPQDRILISLAPADLRKEGSGYDLPMAIAILIAAGQIPALPGERLMVLGELELSGTVRPVRGVLSAVAKGIAGNCVRFIVPEGNVKEANILAMGKTVGVKTLREAADALCAFFSGESIPQSNSGDTSPEPACKIVFPLDFKSFKGQPITRRALEIAAAGRHNLVLFGPPGSGKTFAAKLLPSILPELTRDEAIDVTRIHSMAGLLESGQGLIKAPPFRSPHHGASPEGIIGGGRSIRPGEISLAHKGVLFLDEAPEFRKDILASLREPIEDGEITISRAGQSIRLPADFLLVLAANPCPCGNLGRVNAACVCSDDQIAGYWKRIGGALLDRVDLHVPMLSQKPGILLNSGSESSKTIAGRVKQSRIRQTRRFGNERCNAGMDAAEIEALISISPSVRQVLGTDAVAFQLSSRAIHSVLKVALTIADLACSETVEDCHIYEALSFRARGPEKIAEIYIKS